MSRATKNVAPPPPLLPNADDRAAAQNPETPPDQLRKLARKHRHRAVAALVAANPAAPPKLLDKLGKSRSWHVRSAVAANPATSPDVVEKLASDQQWGVRYGAAGSPQLNAKTARLLLTDSPPVRLRLAANPTLPLDVVAQLAQNRDPWVQGQTASHPAMDDAALRKLADDLDGSAWVLNQIVANDACPADLADQLAVWTALGGGSGDAEFDPLTCEGNPGDDDYAAATFRRLAREPNRFQPHALWAVRCQRSPDHPPNSDDVERMLNDPVPRVRAVALQRAPSLFIPTKTFIVDHDPDPEVVAAAERFTTKEAKAATPTKKNFPVGIGIFFLVIVVIRLLPDTDSNTSISTVPSITFPPLSTIEPLDLFGDSATTPGGATLRASKPLTTNTVTVTVATEANSIEIARVVQSDRTTDISLFVTTDSTSRFTFEREGTSSFFTVEFVEEGVQRSALLQTAIPFTFPEPTTTTITLPPITAPTTTVPTNTVPPTEETSSP